MSSRLSTSNPVDPPDLSSRDTIRHLVPLWWEQRRLVGFGLVGAFVFTGLTITIPILIQHTIDDAIDAKDHQLLVPLLAAIVGVATLRMAIGFLRRYATARVGIAVEALLRNLLYDACLRSPR